MSETEARQVGRDVADVKPKAKGMRETLSEQAAEIAALKQQLEEQTGANRAITMRGAYTELGFNPDVGVGKAIATLYQGDAEGLAEYALTEFQYEPSAPAHPQAAQIALGWAQLDQVGNVASSMSPGKSREERLRDAQESGDMERVGAIQAAQMEEMMRRVNAL